MRPWEQRLRAASFRGAPFQVFAHDADGFGRRAQVHEYPERDVPYVEDLGEQTQQFSVEGYVIGPDYDLERDRLIDACRAPGAGRLVHPSLGELDVVCLACSVRESTHDGGMAIFRLRFVQAGENRFPRSEPFGSKLVTDAADAAATTARTVFVEDFVIAGHPQWLCDAAAELVVAASDLIRQAAGQVTKTTGIDLASLTRTLDQLAIGATAAVTDPSQLATDLSSAISEMLGLAETPSSAISALETLLTFGGATEAVIGTTVLRLQQARNQAALIALVRDLAAVEAARAADDVPLASYRAAVELRDRLSTILEQEILTAGDAGSDHALEALRDLRVEIVRSLTQRAGRLARVLTFVPAGDVPAVVLAYRLYEDSTRAAEIVARNGLSHPGFVPGGAELEVLST